MKNHRETIAAVLVGVVLRVSSAFALHAGLVGADGECLFTKAFIQDYETAQQLVDARKSAEPLLMLLTKYQKSEEQAELELSISKTKGQVVRRKRHCGRRTGSDKLLTLEGVTEKGERKAVGG